MRKLDKALWCVVIFFGIVMVLIISTSSGQTHARIGTMLAFPFVMIIVTLFVIFMGDRGNKNEKNSETMEK